MFVNCDDDIGQHHSNLNINVSCNLQYYLWQYTPVPAPFDFQKNTDCIIALEITSLRTTKISLACLDASINGDSRGSDVQCRLPRVISDYYLALFNSSAPSLATSHVARWTCLDHLRAAQTDPRVEPDPQKLPRFR